MLEEAVDLATLTDGAVTGVDLLLALDSFRSRRRFTGRGRPGP